MSVLDNSSEDDMFGDDSSLSFCFSSGTIREVEYDNLESGCLVDMKGTRIFLVEKLAGEIRNRMCCKKCALSGHKRCMHNFLAFTEAHDEVVNMEENRMFFGSRLEHIEWKVDH